MKETVLTVGVKETVLAVGVKETGPSSRSERETATLLMSAAQHDTELSPTLAGRKELA